MRKETFIERSLPNNDDAERAVIGAILIDNTLITEAAERLIANDFYSPINRRIFQAMLELFEASKKIDAITIADILKREGPIESIGGVAAIANFTFGIPHWTSITDWVSAVSRHSRARKLVKICHYSADELINASDEFENVLDRHEQFVHELRNRDIRDGFTRLEVISADTINQIVEFSKDRVEGLLGISTGHKDIDLRTSGLEKSDLIILAARPSMGKTALGLQMSYRAASTPEKPVVAVFELEMTRRQLTQRILASEARVDLMRMRRGHIGREEWNRVHFAHEQLKETNLYIDDSPHLSTMEIRAKARRLRAEVGQLDLIMIDHLGLIKAADPKQSRHLQLSEITKSLKGIAKSFEVPVLVLHQLSRAPELRKPPKPIMSDLRESGAIEEDADIVMFIYREDYYNREKEPTNIAEIIFGKNRNGPTGTDKLTFLKEFTRFEDYHGFA